MRILLVTNLYPPEERGGAEKLVRMTAQAFARLGHDVFVFTTTKRRIEGTEKTDDGNVHVTRFHPSLPYHILEDACQPFPKRVAWHVADLFEWHAGRLLRRVMDDVKPDLVISHNMRGMGMSVARGLKTSGVFWMHTLHDVQLLVPSGLRWVRAAPTFLTRMWQSAFVTWPYSRWTKWLVGSPHVIVRPSTFVVHTHATMGLFEHSRRLVLENPLDLKLSVRPRDLRHNPFRLLYIGQLELHKGVFVLLAALMHIHESLELTIAGAGSLEDKLVEQSLALPTCVSIVWKGSVSREEVGALLQRSDALVFPSLVAENCPGVLLEARAVGLPIIASNVGGVSEFVHESGLVPPGTPRALAQKIHEAMNGRVECLHRPVQSVGEYVLGILEEVTSEK